MKLCFFSPYLTNHHSGGGEKHLFDTAIVAAEKHEVYVAITTPSTLSSRALAERSEITSGNKTSFSKLNTIAETDLFPSDWRGLHSAQDDNYLERTKKIYEKFLGYSLKNIEFISSPLHTDASFLKKLVWTKQFDGLYYVTDGSLFFSLAKNNYLHIQIPFTQSKHSLVERLKLANWKHKNTNSEFTKKYIERNWNTAIDLVHYPVVDMKEFDPQSKKENILLSVGRFFTQLHAKRQDITIEIFKQFIKTYPELAHGWKLVLAGSVEDQDYFESLQKKSVGFPVEFKTDLKRKELVELFNRSNFYLHSAGYDIDEEKNPEKVEHFGITTVEAMAAGCVPLAYNAGGQREILSGELKKLLWTSKDELVKKLENLIKEQSSVNGKNVQSLLRKRVRDFDSDSFRLRVEKMFGPQ